MTSPSSGVKPIVVSTLRPPRTAASEAPAPRWQVTTRSADRPPDELAGAARGAGVGQAVEAVAADRPALAPLPRHRVGRRRGRDRGVECGVEAGDCRHVRAAARSPRRARRATWAGAAGRGRRARPAPPRTSASIRTGPVKRAPPCTTRCPTTSGGSQSRRSASGSPSGARSAWRDPHAVVEQPQLQARGPGVDDQDARARHRPRSSSRSPGRPRRARGCRRGRRRRASAIS